MKRTLVFLTLFAVVALADEPKFHFNDCVVVARGFYRGCHGLVSEQRGPNDFEINLSCKGGGGVTQSFSGDVLKLAKSSLCKE
jgi:hypothetical protein